MPAGLESFGELAARSLGELAALQTAALNSCSQVPAVSSSLQPSTPPRQTVTRQSSSGAGCWQLSAVLQTEALGSSQAPAVSPRRTSAQAASSPRLGHGTAAGLTSASAPCAGAADPIAQQSIPSFAGKASATGVAAGVRRSISPCTRFASEGVAAASVPVVRRRMSPRAGTTAATQCALVEGPPPHIFEATAIVSSCQQASSPTCPCGCGGTLVACCRHCVTRHASEPVAVDVRDASAAATGISAPARVRSAHVGPSLLDAIAATSSLAVPAQASATTAPMYVQRKVPDVAPCQQALTSSASPGPAGTLLRQQLVSMRAWPSAKGCPETLVADCVAVPGKIWISDGYVEKQMGQSGVATAQRDGLSAEGMVPRLQQGTPDLGPPTSRMPRLCSGANRPVVAFRGGGLAKRARCRSTATSPTYPSLPDAEADNGNSPGTDEAVPKSTPRSHFAAWPCEPWSADDGQADNSEAASQFSSSSSLLTATSLVRVAAAGTMRRATNDPQIRGDAQSAPWCPRAFAAGSLSTTSCGSSASAVQSPHPDRPACRHAHPEHCTNACEQHANCGSPDSWIQAVAYAEGLDSSGDEERTQAAELDDACNAMSRELARLTSFVQWADTLVSNTETAFAAKDCPAIGAEPECFYIGDGIVAQLLADAEAVAQLDNSAPRHGGAQLPVHQMV